MTSPGGERERERFRQTLDGLLYFNPDEPSSAAIGAHLGGSSAPASASASAASRSANEPDARGRRVARPGDRGDFLRRLATFAPGKWFAKPPILSPVPCARKGWECVAVDALRCEACLARVIVRAPPDATREQLLEIAVKQAGKLDDAHEESCAWRGAASPIALARFPRVSDEDLRKDFIARRDALVAVDALPLVTSPIRDALDVSTCVSTTRRVKWLAREATKSESGGAEGEETSVVAGLRPAQRDDAHAAAATTLALTGWRVDSIVPNRGVVLRCDMCESRAAAWNFPKGTTAKREDGAGVAAAGGVDDWVGANAKRRRATAAATGAQLLGAIGGAFGAFGGAIGSIAGGASPSVPGGSAFGSGGGFAFGVGAATSTPFGAPPASAGAAAARVADSSPIRPFGAALTAAGVDASAGKRKRGADGDEAEDKTAAEEEPKPTPKPKPKPSAPGAMHPLRQHRAHCAWATVNADTFSGGVGAGAVAGVRPGWARALDAAAPASEFIHLDDDDGDDDDDDDGDGGGAKTPGGGNDAAGGGGNVDEDGAAVDGTPGGSGVKIDYSYLGARTAVARYVTGES